MLGMVCVIFTPISKFWYTVFELKLKKTFEVEKCEEICIRMGFSYVLLIFLFLFSTQNQVPKIIMGVG